MSPSLKFSTLAAALIAIVSCATTEPAAPKPAEDLDIAMTPGPQNDPTEPPVTYENVVPTKSGQSADAGPHLPATAVMDWQSFFKPPPTARQRTQLETRLDKWTDDATPKTLLERGRAETAVGRTAAAETSFRKALRLDPSNLEAQLELAALYLKRRDTALAFEFLAQIKEGINTSDNVSQTFLFRYRYTLALAYIAREDREKGHKVLSDLIGLDKGFTPAYVALATSYLTLGRDSVAEFVVRRGLDRAKDDAPLLNLMGVLTQKSRQLEAARSWYDKALAAQPTYAPALVNRANLSLQSFEYAAAEEDLKTAIAEDPLNADAYVALGIAQKKQGNLTNAKASLTKAVDLEPDNAYARFNLGVLMADELKRPNEALRLFHEVLQTSTKADDLKELARSYINDLKQVGEER